MRKTCLLLAAMILMVFPVACSDGPTGPNEDACELQDGVSVIDIAGLLGSGTLRWELNGTTWELWIKKSLSNKGDSSPFKVGDVLYCVPTLELTSIVFHKVTGWTTTTRGGDYYRVNVVQADLIDVYKEASIHKRIPLKGVQTEYELLDPTVTLNKMGQLSLVKTKLRNMNCSSSSSNSITITRGIVEIRDPFLKLDIEIHDSTLQEFSTILESRNILDCDMDVSLALSTSCWWYKTVAKLQKRTIVQVGVVPVLVKMAFTVDVGFEVGGALTASLRLENYEANISTQAGIVYRNDTGAPCNPESACYTPVMTYEINSYSADSDPLAEFKAKFYCGPYVQETVSVTFYEVIGPEFWAKQYLHASVEYPGEGCGWEDVRARLVLGNDFGGGLTCKIGKKTLLRWEPKDFKPLEKELWTDCVKIL